VKLQGQNRFTATIIYLLEECLKMKKTVIATAILASLGAAASVQAAQVPSGMVPAGTWLTTDRANFTMINSAGGTFGGTNDVDMTWDGSVFTDISDYTGPGGTSNVTASSTTTFFGALWTAHDIQVFAPGSYTFDVTTATAAAPNGANGETGTVAMNVASNQLGMHMLFDWNGNNNIDVVVIAEQNQVFGAGLGRFTSSACGTPFGPVNNTAGCLWDGPGFVGGDFANAPDPSAPWGLVSVDSDDPDNIPGTPMATNGPFAGSNANFMANMTPTPAPSAVPVPAAVWLFGSGLMGLVGVARRRKSS